MIITKSIDNLIFKLIYTDISTSNLIHNLDRLTPNEDLPIAQQVINSVYGSSRLERNARTFEDYSGIDGYISDIINIFTIPFIYDCASSLIKEYPPNTLTFRLLLTILYESLKDFLDSLPTKEEKEAAFKVNTVIINYLMEVLRYTTSSNFDNISRNVANDIVN